MANCCSIHRFLLDSSTSTPSVNQFSSNCECNNQGLKPHKIYYWGPSANFKHQFEKIPQALNVNFMKIWWAMQLAYLICCLCCVSWQAISPCLFYSTIQHTNISIHLPLSRSTATHRDQKQNSVQNGVKWKIFYIIIISFHTFHSIPSVDLNEKHKVKFH